MSESPTWTPGEQLAVAAARLVRPDDVVVVGLGLPQVAAMLAKRTTCPDATLLLELGVFEPSPTESTMGIADPRMWAGATAFGSMLDVLGAMLHGGRVTLGLLGALQVDAGGNVNTTAVTDEDGATRRFNGSGGGNDIASSAGRVVVLVRHEARKFRDAVEFLTSPGRRPGGRPRDEVGLAGEGTAAIVTDRAVLSVDDAGCVLDAVHPGEQLSSVLDAVPTETRLPPGGPAVTPPPTPEELHLIRCELDPDGLYTR